MECPFCDAHVPAKARYCPNCGTLVDDRGHGPPVEPASTNYYEAPSAAPAPPPVPTGWSPPTTSPMALLSLISALLAWFFILPFVGAIAAVITGHLARREIRQAPHRYEGDGLALTGLILGYLQIGLVLLFIVFVIVIIAIGAIGAAATAR